MDFNFHYEVKSIKKASETLRAGLIDSCYESALKIAEDVYDVDDVEQVSLLDAVIKKENQSD